MRWVAQCGGWHSAVGFRTSNASCLQVCCIPSNAMTSSAESPRQQNATYIKRTLVGCFVPSPPHRSRFIEATHQRPRTFSGEGKGFLRPKITYMQATFAPCENPMMPSNGLCSISTATGWASQTCRVIYSLFEQCAQRRQETVHGGGGGGGVVGGGMSPALLTLAPQRCRGCTA